MIQAGDGSLSDSDRAAQATQLQGYRDQLLTLANSTDGSGNYLFSGFQSTTAPFSNAPGGGVTYSGDTGTRQVQIADTRAISQGDNGANVFLSVPMLGSQPVRSPARATRARARSARCRSRARRPRPTRTSSRSRSAGRPPRRPIRSPTTPWCRRPRPRAAVFGRPGIALGNGLSVPVSGTPAPGDTFTVRPAPKPAPTCSRRSTR
ncbi:bacterial flagellin N-terminal helical region family protein [Burkholderia cepacia]|nr:bacterial flagellin N-terminal helical region family protein [Burkholderia cepacia]